MPFDILSSSSPLPLGTPWRVIPPQVLKTPLSLMSGSAPQGVSLNQAWQRDEGLKDFRHWPMGEIFYLAFEDRGASLCH